MTADKSYQAKNSIDGISLASFLQLLEQERKTCSLVVREGTETGKLYFNDGNMIDAEWSDIQGLEAAYSILSWKSPAFHISEAEERITRISQPLTRIILTASTRNDERAEAESPNGAEPAAKTATPLTPLLAHLVNSLAAIPGLKHYYILNKMGKVLAKSSSNRKMGDFIAYCTMNMQQMRDAVGAKSVQNIRIRLADDNMLLIIPGKSITFGLLLSQSASITEIYKGLRQALSHK